MGTARWSADDWASYSTTTAKKTTSEIFKNNKISNNLNPFDVKVRESRDSKENPNSTAIIVGVDVTGSMGIIADNLVKNGLGIMVEEILKRKPVTDPHLMLCAIGDAYYDRSPFQVTQFEADLKIAKQLEDFYLEHGGGGNCFESYNLPWYFASMHTSIDCYEKRNKKGYIFTIGDEEAPKDLTKSQIKQIFNDDVEINYTSEQLYDMASKMYNIFHIVVEEGSHAKHSLTKVLNSWNNLIGQKVIRLSNYKDLAQVIVSTIEVNEGANIDSVVNSWSGNTGVVVRKAITDLKTYSKQNEIIRF